jgi:hypothetical protein
VCIDFGGRCSFGAFTRYRTGQAKLDRNQEILNQPAAGGLALGIGNPKGSNVPE